ncbi:hypothetical protein PRZ48_009718 [Zasmidium cellare]|uniref:Uncharacterized protein n=1 Tax=Zasmidium cellare TaxID=395010 RepID=A0ABR0ECG3_ZASCE|nr:hypothetical protein PRZ48_009718 [Zasmidium cellare]
MAPIPIVLCGKHPDMCDNFIRGMLPEYEVVHVCHNAPVAKSELPALLKGERTEPCSGKGSNTKTRSPKIPKAIFVGGGFSETELEEMRAVDVLRTVPWMYPPANRRPKTNGPPPMEMIIARAKEAFVEHGFVEGKEDQVEVGLWDW